MPTLLELNKLSKSFGAIEVANHLDLSIEQGQAFGIIGPNGAGKTSVFNLINGSVKPDSGEIIFNGKIINNLKTNERSHLGISRSFQIPKPFGTMSVFENVLVAAFYSANKKKELAYSLCLNVLKQTNLLDKANVITNSLSLLERKRLELARSLCAKPKLLLLDEIAGGLSEQECLSLVETIKDIRRTGISIIWIEHIVKSLLAVVDHLIVMNFGKKIAEGKPHEIIQGKEVRSIYLGV